MVLLTDDDVRRAPGDHPFLNGALIRPGAHEPVARSAIHHRLRGAGARFEPRHGWLTPVALPGDASLDGGPWLVDLSHVAKLEVRGGPEPEPAPDRAVHLIAPGRRLVLCRREQRLSSLAEIRAGAGLALDVSGAWTCLGLAGPHAPQLLRRLTTAPSPPAAAPVADVPGQLISRHGVTWLLVSSEYGQHLWDVAVEDGAELGARPVGVDVLLERSNDPLIA